MSLLEYIEGTNLAEDIKEIETKGIKVKGIDEKEYNLH